MSTEETVAATEEQPVEEVEEQQEATTEEEVATTETVEEEEGEQPPPKGRDAESRIKELNYKFKKANEAAELEREKAQFYREQYEKGATKEPQKVEEQTSTLPPAPVPPDRFDYDSDEDYRAAQQSFQHENARYFQNLVEEREKAAVAQQQNAQKQQMLNTRQQTLTQKIEAGRDKYHDFDMVALDPTANIPYTDTMIEGLTDAEHTADIAYYFGQNPAEAQKVAQLPPLQQVLAIGKLDVQVALKQTKTTNAPPPNNPVKAGNAGAVVDPDKLSADEWRKWRDGEIAKREGRA